MTRKELLKAIAKQEKSLLRSFKALHGEKQVRSNQAFQLMKEIFTEVKKTGEYKTVGKSKMKKDELLTYLEQLDYIRELKSSTVKGWKEQRKQWREEAKKDNIPVDEIDENYDEWIDNIDSRPWQEIAGYYYDSDTLNKIRWMEENEAFETFMNHCKAVEARYSKEFEGYEKISEVLTKDNWKEIVREVWNSGRL